MLRDGQEVALLDSDLRELVERFGPCIDQVPIVIDQV
jgi:hypothetical protein